MILLSLSAFKLISMHLSVETYIWGGRFNVMGDLEKEEEGCEKVRKDEKKDIEN